MLGHFGPRWHHIWLMLSHFSGILWFVLALVGQELGPYWAYLGPFWAMLGHFWQRWHRIALILSHVGPRWSKDARQTWQEVSQHSSSQRSKDTRRAWQSSRDTLWHSSKATNLDTHHGAGQPAQQQTNMAGGEPAQQQTQQGHQPAGATQPWQQGPNLGHLGLRTAAASAARTPTEHSCIRNVAARTYFETPPKHGGRPASAARTGVGEQPVQQAGSNTGAGQPAQQHMTKNMGCPPGMSPQQQQPAPYSLLAWVPLSLRSHKHMAIPIA